MWRWAFCACLLCLACGSAPTPPGAGVRVRTDRTSYAVGQSIAVEVANPGPDTAFAWHCNFHLGVTTEQRTDTGWTEVSAQMPPPICIAILLSGLMPLPPGTSHGETGMLNRPGTYRLSVDAGRDVAHLRPVYSNTFVVR